jgi:hypothetical protein
MAALHLFHRHALELARMALPQSRIGYRRQAVLCRHRLRRLQGPAAGEE